MSQLEDIVLNDREILPVSYNKFGVVVTEEEAKKFLEDGYTVKAWYRRSTEEDSYYLVVHVGVRPREEDFNIEVLDWVGHTTVVISSVPWTIGERSGIKAYVKSAEKIA